ncbi:MAG: thiamine phosphate synthase [Dethiobacter sp.]
MNTLDLSLYVISGQCFTPDRELLKVMEEALAGGATVIQLREKNMTVREMVEVGAKLQELARRHGATFIINDHIDVALAIDADGVHLGQDDLPVSEARAKLGPKKIIGLSTHSLEQALAASSLPLDYLGVGPVFTTPTKPDALPVGLELLEKVSRQLTVPFVAIGGIDETNLEQVLAVGARNVAVIRAVVAADDVVGAARRLKARIVVKTA